MCRKLLLILVFCQLLISLCSAQQDPQYSQYMFNMLSINPAYAGSRDVLSVTGIYRRQWVGVEGAPTTQMISIDSPLKNKKVGLGLQIVNDQIGINKTTSVYATYAYRIRLRKGTIAMGIQGGFQRFSANYSSLQLSGNQADPAFASNLNEYMPNIGAGVYYNTDRFYIGFSAPHLLGEGGFYGTNTNETVQRQNAHWLLAAGYVFDLSPAVALKPSVLFRMVQGTPVHADINANVWFYKTVAIGVSYRTGETLAGMLELQLNRQFRLGYSYDYTLSSLRNSGSHEIMLRYEFGYEKKRMISPRFF